MHTGIYRSRPEALGIVHTHARYSTTLACLLRNHGTIAIGSTVGEAYSRTELLEQMAELYYRARTAGEPVILTAEQMVEVSAKIHDYGQYKLR